MRKLVLLALAVTAVALAGCLPQAQATPTSTTTLPATSTATRLVEPSPTVVPTLPEETPFLPGSGCTVITREPTPGPTAESIVPPVSEADWTRGPVDAKVTIIEYSDFQ